LHTYPHATNNRLRLHQRGYLFATARQQELQSLQQQAETNAGYGGGELRHHQSGSTGTSYRASPDNGFANDLDGADLITSQALIQRHFPYLTQDTAGVLHVRKCGVLSAHELGMTLLETARNRSVEFITGELRGCDTSAGQLTSVTVNTGSKSQEIKTSALVLATGPYLKATAALAGTDLPVVVEKHVKINLADTLGIIPRHAPLSIWNDPTDLVWSDEERALLADSADTKYLSETFPAGVHGRPVGAGNQVFIYWTYDCPISDHPQFPVTADDVYPEILLRGMTRMVPGLSAYLDPMPRPYVDGGYYTKMADNRPVIGPLSVPGTYVCSAFSGYGIMASCAAGKLLASHITGSTLPQYASAFTATRFDDPAYLAHMSHLSGSGQI
ncbi:MAG: FAD-binding oxidoreductase, partial [Pseudomonadota bacterium]